MADGLIYDDEKNARTETSTRWWISGQTNQGASGGLPPSQTPLPSYQGPFGTHGLQSGYQSPISSTPQQYYQQTYVVSP